MKVQFKKIKNGKKFKHRYTHFWENEYGRFCEKSIGVFIKDGNDAYEESTCEYITPKPDEFVEVVESGK